MSRKSEHESSRGPSKGEAYGIAAVTQPLKGLAFPASTLQILDKLKGHEEVHWTKDHTVNLREIFTQVDKKEFQSVSELAELVSEKARELQLSSH